MSDRERNSGESGEDFKKFVKALIHNAVSRLGSDEEDEVVQEDVENAISQLVAASHQDIQNWIVEAKAEAEMGARSYSAMSNGSVPLATDTSTYGPPTNPKAGHSTNKDSGTPKTTVTKPPVIFHPPLKRTNALISGGTLDGNERDPKIPYCELNANTRTVFTSAGQNNGDRNDGGGGDEPDPFPGIGNILGGLPEIDILQSFWFLAMVISAIIAAVRIVFRAWLEVVNYVLYWLARQAGN